MMKSSEYGFSVRLYSDVMGVSGYMYDVMKCNI